MHRWLALGAVLVAFARVPCGQAQTLAFPGGELDDYYRLLELSGDLTGAPLIFRSPSRLQSIVITGDSTPWAAFLRSDSAAELRAGRAQLLPAELKTVYNSRYPRGINDGALWAGRGVSGSLTLGGRIKLGPITATAYPTAWFTQNDSFDIVAHTIPGLSPFGYPWWDKRIDWPQRFGNKALAKLDPGQSDVRLGASWFTAGVSTENLLWGAAFRNPIIMSPTAAGFPHVDLGTGRVTHTPVGNVEARLVWGRLAESAFFDTISTNNGRLFTGFTLALEPRWTPGLIIGLTRVLYVAWDSSLKFTDFIDVFQPFFKRQLATSTDPEGDDDRDQLLSLIARWVLPESGFETYIEWAKNDHNINLRDFLLEPDHSYAFTLGFQKSYGRGAARNRIRGEWTHLGTDRTFLLRPTPAFYQHRLVVQGYTNRGQILGAGIGPGSDSQHLGFDRYTARGRWGFFVQRVRLDDDAYYAHFAQLAYEGHNVEVSGGVSLLRSMRAFEIGGMIVLSRELNRHYEIRKDVTNLNLQFSLRWNPNRGQGSGIRGQNE